MKIKKPENFYIETNLLENRYLTNGNIWTVDETIFNSQTKLFLVVSLKTRVILGYIQGENCRNEDLIIELYKQILEEYEFSGPPSIIHSDMEDSYHSKKVREFLKEHNVHVSVTEGLPRQNQVSEAVNSRIKYLITEMLLEDSNSAGYRGFKKSLPDKLQSIRLRREKCNNKEYRKYLFNSDFFKSQQHDVIQKAIIQYNKTDYSKRLKGVSREEAHYYDSFVEPQTIDNTALVSADHLLAQRIQDENESTIEQVKTAISQILQTNTDSEQKIAEIVSLVFQRHDKSDVLLQQGLIGLSLQNAVLIQYNQELKQDNKAFKQDNQEIKEELLKVSEKLAILLAEQAEVRARKEKRRKQRRLPAKDPLTNDLYDFFIQEAYLIYRETYQGARLRIALALLAVTGVRISELLPLKVHQIQTLFQDSWIAIDRLKRGPANHKAFLTLAGKKIIKERRRDFEIIIFSKDDDSFVFTPQYSANPLQREGFNRTVNNFLDQSTTKLSHKPNIKSHSFRIGFITELWKDTKDIEFVRQAVGHAKIDTTSHYIQNLSAEERKQRMINLKSSKDLFYRD